MRAARFHTHGGPSVLRVEHVAWPFPGADELLVRIHASSVNGTDLGVRRGGGPMTLATKRPFTVGFDIAGEVVACGPRVTAFEPGDRVMALLGHGGGGAAEYVTVKQDRAAPAPESIPLVQAAAIPLAGLTAMQALRHSAGGRVRPGARVLVNGATGGIGAYAVQIARHLGAHVTGVARAEKLGLVRDLGAHDVAARDENILSSGRTWDVIFDTPPALRFADARSALTPGGVFVSTRPIPTGPAELSGLLGRGGPRFAGVMTKERGLDLAYLARLVDAGAVRVPLDRTFTLSEIGAAHRYAESGDARGKIVVTTDG